MLHSTKYCLLVIFAFCFFCESGLAQRMHIIVNHSDDLDDAFFHRSDSMYNPMTLVFTDEQGRIHYDNVPDSSKYPIESNCIINNDPDKQLRSADAYRLNDTLRIKIVESNAAEYFEFIFTYHVYNYYAELKYGTPMMGDADIDVIEAELWINKRRAKKGEMLWGKVRFTAVCKKNCGDEKIKGEGYFKCIVE